VDGIKPNGTHFIVMAVDGSYQPICGVESSDGVPTTRSILRCECDDCLNGIIGKARSQQRAMWKRRDGRAATELGLIDLEHRNDYTTRGPWRARLHDYRTDEILATFWGRTKIEARRKAEQAAVELGVGLEVFGG